MQGVMAIPSLFLFHNGKAAARYNETEYKIDLFASFITRFTGENSIFQPVIPSKPIYDTYLYYRNY